jgi:CBS domain-containing protein
MARYRDDDVDERSYYSRDARFERERPWNFNSPFIEHRRADEYSSERGGRGRFGERADYEYDEPRFSNYPEHQREGYDRSYDQGYEGRRESYTAGRSRLRARDIMTRELAIATLDTSLMEVAIMMRDEDTGVIPVVDSRLAGNGGGNANTTRGAFVYGRLVGLITDRDLVCRAVAEGKDCRDTRAEEVMSTDIVSARPNDRVVDIIRRMGDKQVRRIPVTSDNGTLRGMISMSDIALETDADRELAQALEEISKESSFWGRLFT